MAHDVNQSEMDDAAQVRSALVEKIGSERIDLWIPDDTEWEWLGNALTLRFSSEFTCQLAKKMLLTDLNRNLHRITQSDAEVLFETRLRAPITKKVSPAISPSMPLLTNLEVETASASIDSAVSIEAKVKNSPGKRVLPATSFTLREETSLVRASQTDIAVGESPYILPLESGSQAVQSNIEVTKDVLRADEGADQQHANHRRGAGAKTGNVATGIAATLPTSVASASPRPARDICEMFVMGDCNALGWTTANMIISDPGRLTPVLMHGPHGCGKSMLITGIVQQLRTRRRMQRVVHMTSEQFTNDFTEGLRTGGLPMFRRKYRDVEALVLDDIQFFAGKKSTIAELKHTMDNLVRLGKQVVLTADRSLNDLDFLGHELVGRLRGGLSTPLSPLDDSVRAKLLTRKIADAGLSLADDIIHELSARACGDGRVISGMVNRLIATGALRNGELDWETCWSAVSDLVQATQPVVRLGDIERVVCSMFGLDSQSLQTSSKHRSVTQPRMLAMFLARKYTPAAYQEIGQYFGRRKHSTVISAEKTVNGWLAENPSLQLARGLTVKDAIRQVEAQLQVG